MAGADVSAIDAATADLFQADDALAAALAAHDAVCHDCSDVGPYGCPRMGDVHRQLKRVRDAQGAVLAAVRAARPRP